MGKRVSLLCVLGALALAGGCASPQVTRSENPGEVRQAVVDPSLSGLLQVDRIDLAVPPGGVMRPQVVVTDTRGFVHRLFGAGARKFEYRFHWFDAAGIEQGSANQPWLEKFIRPGETVYLQGAAPSTEVRGFTIEIRDFGR